MISRQRRTHSLQLIHDWPTPVAAEIEVTVSTGAGRRQRVGVPSNVEMSAGSISGCVYWAGHLCVRRSVSGD